MPKPETESHVKRLHDLIEKLKEEDGIATIFGKVVRRRQSYHIADTETLPDRITPLVINLALTRYLSYLMENPGKTPIIDAISIALQLQNRQKQSSNWGDKLVDSQRQLSQTLFQYLGSHLAETVITDPLVLKAIDLVIPRIDETQSAFYFYQPPHYNKSEDEEIISPFLAKLSRFIPDAQTVGWFSKNLGINANQTDRYYNDRMSYFGLINPSTMTIYLAVNFPSDEPNSYGRINQYGGMDVHWFNYESFFTTNQ